MATVGMSEAARLSGVSRQHLYKMIEKGEISVVKELTPGKSGDDPKDYRQLVDVSELHRVFGKLSTVDSSVDSQNRQVITPVDSSVDSDLARLEAELLAAKQLLREREDQLRKAEEREEWLKKQVDETQNIVKLLGAPQATPAPDPAPASPAEKTVSLEKHKRVIKDASERIEELESELERSKSGFFARLFK